MGLVVDRISERREPLKERMPDFGLGRKSPASDMRKEEHAVSREVWFKFSKFLICMSVRSGTCHGTASKLAWICIKARRLTLK